jgi:hypothetical protein
MESVLAGFNPAEALSQLVLAELRLKRNDAAGTTVRRLLNMRHGCSLDHAPFTFLRLLDSAAGQNVWGKDETGTDTWLPAHRTGTDPCGIAAHSHFWNRLKESAMYHCTIQFANHEYPTWKISNDPTATDSAAKVALLAYTVFRSQVLGKAVNLLVLEALFDRGLLRARTRMQPRVVPYEPIAQTTRSNGSESNAANDILVDTAPVVPRYGEVEISVWQDYLINQWLIQQILPVSRLEPSHQVNIRQFGEVVERFLRRGVVGAETRFIVWVSRLDQTKVYFAIGGDPAGVGWVTTKTLVDVCWVRPKEYLVGVESLRRESRHVPRRGGRQHWSTCARSGAG